MKINKTYRSLLDKSINSMLSAIEIYNKPNFSYREETFTILAINSWELLFKAQLLKLSGYNMKSLYVMEPVLTVDGKLHKRNKKPKLGKSKNPITLGLFDVLKKLEIKGCKLTRNHLCSIDSLIELRDTSVHFYNEKSISKEIQELGFACIKNYMHIIKKWELEIDLSTYNFYLMPLAYVDSKIISTGAITGEVKNYLEFVKNEVDKKDKSDEDFDIAISIEINFSKSNSFESLGFKYDPNGLSINITEQDIRQKFPLTYGEVCKKSKKRYENFKQGNNFNIIMRNIKKDKKLFHERRLDTENPKSAKQGYYSSNIWKELDNEFEKIVISK